MDSEKRNELSELTEIAVKNNDVATLKNILKIIELDIQNSPYIIDDATEWFESLLPDYLFEAVFS